jgi:hypothetical protein
MPHSEQKINKEHEQEETKMFYIFLRFALVMGDPG